jgi:hypothetical protein
MGRTILGLADDGAVILADSDYGMGALTRVDSSGTQIWNVKYRTGTTNWDSNLNLRDVVQTHDSAFASVGYSVSPLNSISYVAVIKTNLNGDTLWTSRFNKTTPENMVSLGNVLWNKELTETGFLQAYGITQLTDGTIYLVGNRATGTPGVSSFLLKLDTDGNILSGQAIGDMNILDVIDHDGYIYCLGYSGSYITIVKMDYSNSIIWNKSYYYTSQLDYSRKCYLRTLSNGNLTVVYGDRYFTTYGVIVDQNGSLLHSYNQMWGGSDVVETKKKGLFMIGYGPLYGIKMLNYDHTGLIRTDSLYTSTNCSWETSLTTFEPIVNQSNITVNASSVIIPLPLEMTYTIEALGEQPGCVEMWGSIDELGSIPDVVVSPNPSDGVVLFEQKDNLAMIIVINDLQGREITVTDKRQGELSIDLSKEKAGCYFYTVQFENGKKRTGKLILN